MDIPENVINKDLYIKAKQEADLKYKERHPASRINWVEGIISP